MFNPTTRRSGARPAAAARLAIAAIALASSAALSDLAAGQCQYEVTAIIEPPISCPFTGPPDLSAVAMNDAGHVVGWWRDCVDPVVNHPFIWTGDGPPQAIDLPIENLYTAQPTDINNHGDICGWYDVEDDGLGRIGFLLMAEGEFITIPIPDGALNLEAHAINNNRQVCGWFAGGKLPTNRPLKNSAPMAR